MPIIKCLCLCAILMISGTVSASKVTFMVEDFPPYIQRYTTEQGVMLELAKTAFDRVNVSATVEYGSWYQIENALDKQKVLSLMWQKNKQRIKNWHFSEPIYLQKMKYVVRSDFTKDITYLHSLRGLKVALVDGITYGDKLEGIRNRLNITSVASDFAALEKLKKGEVELTVMDPLIAAYMIKGFYGKAAKDFKFIESSHFSGTPYYLVCGKNYGNCLGYIKKFNKGLRLITDDGSKAALLKSAESLK